MIFVPGGFSCTNLQLLGTCSWRKVMDGYNRNIFSLPKHHIGFDMPSCTWSRIADGVSSSVLKAFRPSFTGHCLGKLKNFNVYHTCKSIQTDPMDLPQNNSMEAAAVISMQDFENEILDFQQILNGSGYAGNKMDFTRGNLSPNLQARFCKL